MTSCNRFIASTVRPRRAWNIRKQEGHWIAVPATAGSQMKGPCARIDLFKQHVGLDLTKMYPAGRSA